MTHAMDILRAHGPGTVEDVLTGAGILTEGMGRDARRRILLDYLHAFSSMQARGLVRGTAEGGRLIWRVIE